MMRIRFFGIWLIAVHVLNPQISTNTLKWASRSRCGAFSRNSFYRKKKPRKQLRHSVREFRLLFLFLFTNTKNNQAVQIPVLRLVWSVQRGKTNRSRHLNVSFVTHSPNWTKTRNLLTSQTNKGEVRYLLWWWAQWKFLRMAMTLSLEVSMPFLEDRLGDIDKRLLRRYSMYVWEADLILKTAFVVSNNNNCWKTFRA